MKELQDQVKKSISVLGEMRNLCLDSLKQKEGEIVGLKKWIDELKTTATNMEDYKKMFNKYKDDTDELKKRYKKEIEEKIKDIKENI